MHSTSLKISKTSALLVVLLGVLGLTGWIFDLYFLKSINPDYSSMKANAAILFIISGVLLFMCAGNSEPRSRVIKFVYGIFITFSILIASLTLFEYFLGKDFGIDQIFFSDRDKMTLFPGRMAPNAAILFFLTALSIILLSPWWKSAKNSIIAGILGLILITACFFSLADYPKLGMDNVLGNYNPMAYTSAFAFLIMGIGIISLSINLSNISWSLKRGITLGFIFGLVLILAMSLFANSSTISLRQTYIQVAHTDVVRFHINELQSDFEDIELNRQNYLLYGDGKYRSLALKSVDAFNSELKIFKELTRDNQKQQDKVTQLVPLVSKRYNLLIKVLSAFQNKGREEAIKVIQESKIPELIEKINTILTDADNEELSLLKMREENTSASTQRTFILLPIGALASVAILVWIFILLNSEVTERLNSESALIKSEERFRSIFELSADLVCIADYKGFFRLINPSFTRVLGYSQEDLLHNSFFKYIHPDDKAKTQSAMSEVLAKGETLHSLENRYIHKNGSLVWLGWTAQPTGNDYYFCIARNITERKLNEEHINRVNRLYSVLSRISHAMVQTDNRLKLFDETCRILVEYGKFRMAWIGEIDQIKRIIKPVSSYGKSDGYLNNILVSINDSKLQKGPTGASMITGQFNVCNDIQNDPRMEPWREKALKLGFRSSAAFPVKQKDKLSFPLTVYSAELNFFDENEIKLMNEISLEISFALDSFEKEEIKKKMEAELREAFLYNRNLLEVSLDPLVTINPDGKITDVNNAAELVTGLKRDELIGSDFSGYFTEPGKANEGYQKVFTDGFIKDYPLTIQNKSGALVDVLYNSSVYRNVYGEIHGVFAAARDVTELKKKEAELSKLNENLIRSNAELEQFAYVASHDLQEPLRMVASYTQLLGKRYKDKLDSDANDFINFAVDGATRMQRLINDLLDYSRVTTRGKPFVNTDLSAVVDLAVNNLQEKISESGAVIHKSALPVIEGDELQLMRVFQNLIDNAIKFRGKDIPQIYIDSKEEGGKVLISVKDNGIGIDSKYKDKVFIIFQRLNSHINYPGTGIGLAICKRTIERHGGNVWLESEPGNGTTFYLTLNKRK
jgi:PAS domain S-box-containing protein